MYSAFKEFIVRFVTSSIIGAAFWLVFFYLPNIAFSILLLGILITILIIEWKNLFKLNSFWFWFLMPWYPILPFALMIYMSSTPCYRTLLYYMFLIVFSFDSSAYIIGKIIGIRKIIPSISPGKTVEGYVGGVFGALLAFYIATRYDHINLSASFSILFVFIVSSIAFVGDIFESFLKRQANIKDSSTILPGHGGFLDRFDAVIMASYFFFLFKDSLAAKFCSVF